MDDAAADQFIPVRVGIPGGAGIPAVRMAGPEAQSQPSLPRRPFGREQPSDLQHGGVGAAIIHDAVIPGIVMAGEHDERFVVAFWAWQLRHQQRRFPPACFHFGVQHDLDRFVALHAPLQGIAIRLAQADNNSRRQVRHRCAGGIAPNRRDAHLMQMLVRADVDLADGARQRRPVRCARIGNRLQQHDLAAHVQRGEVLRPAMAAVNDRPAQAVRRRGTRKGVGDAVRCRHLDFDPRSAWQTDVSVVQDQLGLVAVPVEGCLQVAKAFQLLRRSRQLHAAGELLQVPHHRAGIDRGAKLGNAFVRHCGGMILCQCSAPSRYVRLID